MNIGIVIPVFRHSILVVEAIESALSQTCDPLPAIVLVNDGCPHPETHQILAAYAGTYPDRIIYVNKPNGGLSSARNAGVAALISQNPDLDAVYFLDADNRLEPWSIARFRDVLQGSDADWAYPDITRFGIDGGEHFDAPYRVSTHLTHNICEAGSLVARRVFDAGVMFDETMLKGYEDWDFWLSAVEQGFRGVNVPNSGFSYRRRPSSMLSESHESDGALRQELRDKHKKLYAPKAIKAVCAKEVPSLALVDIGSGRVRLFDDPFAPTEDISLAEFSERLWMSLDNGSRHSCPVTVLFTRIDLEVAALKPYVRGLIWQLANGLTWQVPVHVMSLDASDSPLTFGKTIKCSPDALGQKGDMLAIPTKVLLAVLKDPSPSWIENVLMQSDQTLTQQVVEIGDVPLKRCEGTLLDSVRRIIVDTLRNEEFRQGALLPSEWRMADNNLQDLDRFAGTVSVGTTGFPYLPDARPSIAFVLPLLSFGGVDKVTLHVAKAFKASGWRVAICVLGDGPIDLPAAHFDFADDLLVLSGFGQKEWQGEQYYLGQPLPQHDTAGNVAKITAALQYFDCVVNCHSWTLNAAIQGLRKRNVVTCAYTHLFDETRFGRQVGHSPVTLAYEHVYDRIITCSETLRSELMGLGCPPSKLIAVPNAPGFEIPAGYSSAKPRMFSTSHVPKVLFLGRLDRQKGLNRLKAAYEMTSQTAEWRFVGKAVLGGEAGLHPDWLVEPPAFTEEALEDLYRWADFTVLLSDFEGLPLTLLEAMRAGAIPLCTNVGANAEVIRYGENGFLLGQETAAQEISEIIHHCRVDPGLFSAVSQQAQKDMVGRSWETQAVVLERTLGELVMLRRNIS
ncbi:MAG: glycosyltransferase [Pseudoruegeria sp.]